MAILFLAFCTLPLNFEIRKELLKCFDSIPKYTYRIDLIQSTIQKCLDINLNVLRPGALLLTRHKLLVILSVIIDPLFLFFLFSGNEIEFRIIFEVCIIVGQILVDCGSLEIVHEEWI